LLNGLSYRSKPFWNCCLRTTYFQTGHKLLKQKLVMAVWSSPSPVVSNSFVDYVEKGALGTEQHTSSLFPFMCIWYICGLATWWQVSELL
jgi:hypothetical protein